MRLLNGTELVSFIKERQAKQVRNLRQTWHVAPRLHIIVTDDSPVTDVYIRLKQAYGEDILIDVTVQRVTMDDVISAIEAANNNDAIHGIIVQLPLADPAQTDQLLAMIHPDKDVDGLGPQAGYDSATAVAIDWLVNGYNVTLTGRKIVIVGAGRLVGAPLATLWQTAGYDVTVVDDTEKDLHSVVRSADIVITATGVPGLITAGMLMPSAVVVDAGVASEAGKLVGDVAPDVRERQDLTITPEKGGVGPVTVAVLFDHVIQAARAVADES